MEIVNMKVSDLIEYENNARKNAGAIDAVAESIRQCGYIAPIIVDENNVILAGHTRKKALERLGKEYCEVIVRVGLTEEQKKKYRLLDNKTNEFAQWDLEKLEQELAELDFGDFDFGFYEEEKKKLKELDEKPEIQFTEVLGEEHNYVVLYFDNEVDWLQFESIYELEYKMDLSTRTDGKITPAMEHKSIGRVVRGRDFLEKMREHYENFG